MYGNLWNIYVFNLVCHSSFYVAVLSVDQYIVILGKDSMKISKAKRKSTKSPRSSSRPPCHWVSF